MKESNQQLPGYIHSSRIYELWVHTGTNCNLSCSFCFEDSSPGNQRIQEILFSEVKEYLNTAKIMGAKQFSFTGGEPFVNKDILKILTYALQLNPCLVLTNATEPLIKKLDLIAPLAKYSNRLSFRVSVDSHIASEHDKFRGSGNFDKSLTTAKILYDLGFGVSIARQMKPVEDIKSISDVYKNIFAEYGLPEDTTIIPFPDFQKPNTTTDTPFISEHCMTTYQTEDSRDKFMCAFSKMVIKKNDQIEILPCTLVDDTEDYYQGSSLKDSINKNIPLKHHRCFSCFKYGSSCSEG